MRRIGGRETAIPNHYKAPKRARSELGIIDESYIVIVNAKEIGRGDKAIPINLEEQTYARLMLVALLSCRFTETRTKHVVGPPASVNPNHKRPNLMKGATKPHQGQLAPSATPTVIYL